MYLKIGDKSIPAHRNILSCRIQYFSALILQSNSTKSVKSDNELALLYNLASSFYLYKLLTKNLNHL